MTLASYPGSTQGSFRLKLKKPDPTALVTSFLKESRRRTRSPRRRDAEGHSPIGSPSVVKEASKRAP